MRNIQVHKHLQFSMVQRDFFINTYISKNLFQSTKTIPTKQTKQV